MAENIPKILEKGFQNWLKANLALNITKDGLEDAVLNEIKTYHEDLLNDILTPEQILNTYFCTQCTKENILQCPTRGICIVKLGECSFHNSRQKYYRPCPKGVCDRLRDRIKKCHRFNFPSWKNTNTEKWCQNPWELAKCYFPPDGYISAHTIAETDINGILSLLMNHTIFKNKVDENACNEAREIGKMIRHSPTLSIDDNDLNDYLDTLVAFLSCSSLFQGDSKATASGHKIKKLQEESLTITTDDVTRVLLDVIQENTHGSLEKINEATAQRAGEMKADLDKLEKIASENIRDILTAKDAVITEIDEKKSTVIKEFSSSAEQTKLEISKEIKKRKLEVVTDVKNIQTSSVKVIKVMERASIKKIEKAASNVYVPLQRLAEADYELLKNELREDLLAFNRANHSTIPLSPLFDEHDTDLIGFYVLPAMCSVEIHKTQLRGPSSEVRKRISGVRDIFNKKSNRCKNVVLTSEAGQGKTAFCKRLALIWCNAHQINRLEIGHFADDDLFIMRDFDYLFLISLRDSSTADCDIDDMIQNQIVQYLSRAPRYSADFMLTVFHREKTLVLLDGLDEWSHPEQKNSSCRKIPDYLPHRKVREKCTILTTTRSWKLSIANLKSSQIDNHIEIGSVDSKQLMRNTFTKINASLGIPDVIEENIDKINAEIRSGSIEELKGNPLILTCLICLWCDGKPIGQSRCEVYTNILELLLLRAREKNVQLESNDFASDAKDSVTLPVYFETRNNIKASYKFLISLGQMAFQALFNRNKERSLVFDYSLLNSSMTNKAHQFSLYAGLLVQSKIPGQLTSRETRVSFPHKTFQEFFAALYIQSVSDVSQVSEQVLDRCNTVEAILEMANIFIFLSGLAPERVSFLSEKLCTCVNEDEITLEYRRKFHINYSFYRTFKDLQNMCIACVKESRTNAYNFILHHVILDKDFCDKEYSQYLQGLTLNNIKNIKSVQYINSVSEEDTRETIRLFHLKEIHTLEMLHITCPITADDLETLLAGSIDTVKRINVYGCRFQNGRYLKTYNTVSDKCVTTLRNMNQVESLHLQNINMSHAHLGRLTSQLAQKTSMKQIVLFDIKCTDHGDTCDGFDMDLSQHSQLNTTGFADIPLSHLKISTSTLEDCLLGELHNGNALSFFVRDLPSASNLKHLHCGGLNSSLDVVLDTIPLLAHLRKLWMVDIDLRDRSIKLSPEMVDIESVIIKNTSVKSTSFMKLVQDVEQFQQSVRVELHDCTVTPAEEYENIKDYINLSDRIEMLDDGTGETAIGLRVNRFVFETKSI